MTWIWRYNYVPIWTTFGRQMQNDMPIVMQTWKSKPEVEFQRGSRLFSETGSSNISAVDWDILPKFGLRVDFDHPKWAKLPKTEQEVELPRRGRHFEKPMWYYNSGGFIRFGWNLIVRGRGTCTLEMPKMGPVHAPKTENINDKNSTVYILGL